MASLLDLLNDALSEKDWEKVAQARRMLTGEPAPTPVVPGVKGRKRKSPHTTQLPAQPVTVQDDETDQVLAELIRSNPVVKKGDKGAEPLPPEPKVYREEDTSNDPVEVACNHCGRKFIMLKWEAMQQNFDKEFHRRRCGRCQPKVR